MKATLIAIMGALATAISANPCPHGLYSNAQCCDTLVSGVVALDCDSPSSNPRTPLDFHKICARGGKKAACCIVPVAGQDLLCEAI
ncbi:hydrophobin-like protein [Nemania sp. FL0916]|nr:hydrophobin-like protein [Nemania sp. FL0916]